MTHNKPKISVIIPFYNVEKYLRKCLESVRCQTFQDFEVIMVNDESPDNSICIAKEFLSKDNRFKIINQKNKGLGGARNTGILEAKGEFLFLLDSDDYIKENSFGQLINFATLNELDLVVFNYAKVDENGNKIASPEFGSGILSKDEAFRKILSLKTSPQAWNKFYKRNLFINNSILYPEKFLHEDLPVTYRLFWNADKIGYLNESYYYWLVREGSITQKFSYKHINDIIAALLGTKKYLNEQNILDEYEDEYIRGSVQMLNIIVERSFNFSKYLKSKCLVEYVLYIVNSNQVVNETQIKKLDKFDNNLYMQFNNNLNKSKECIGKEVVSHNEKKLLKKVTKLESELFNICNSRSYKVIKQYYKLRNSILPKGSKRRQLIKKIIGRG